MPIIVRGHGDDALAALMKCGATDVEFWCVGGVERGKRCYHRHTISIERLIETVGPDMTMIMLARRARCAICRKIGCHVQAITTLGYGLPEWRRTRLLPGMISRVVADNDDDPGPGAGPVSRAQHPP